MTEELALAIDETTGEVLEPLPSASAEAAPVVASAPAQSGGVSSAIFAAIGELPTWITAEKAGAHKNKYATLKNILDAVRPVLLKHGIRIRQGADRSFMLDEGGGIKGRLVPVYTDFIHVASGEVERTIMEIPITRLDPQAMGSAITYGKRYTIVAGLGLATDEADDDGERAKIKGIGDAHSDSAELAAMTREMIGHADLTKLEDWARSQGKRFSALSEEEQGILKARKAARVKELMAPSEELKKATKKGAAE